MSLCPRPLLGFNSVKRGQLLLLLLLLQLLLALFKCLSNLGTREPAVTINKSYGSVLFRGGAFSNRANFSSLVICQRAGGGRGEEREREEPLN